MWYLEEEYEFCSVHRSLRNNCNLNGPYTGPGGHQFVYGNGVPSASVHEYPGLYEWPCIATRVAVRPTVK